VELSVAMTDWLMVVADWFASRTPNSALPCSRSSRLGRLGGLRALQLCVLYDILLPLHSVSLVYLRIDSDDDANLNSQFVLSVHGTMTRPKELYT
jgi:hypothetical protein